MADRDLPLQKPPLGLLGAFALKVLGRTPAAFGGTIVPVVDVFDQYLAQGELQVRRLTAQTTGTTSSWTTTLTVPAGKAWRVIAAGGYVGLNAADVAVILGAGVFVQAPNDAPLTAPVFTSNPPQVAGIRAFGTTFRPPLFITAQWSVVLNMVASAALTVSVPWFPYALIQEVDI